MTNSDITSVGFIKHIGGIQFKKVSDNSFEFHTKVQSFNLNSKGISHGGYIASILDSGMGTAAHEALEKNQRCVTISLDIKFISASKEGEVLIGKVEVTKKTKSLVFVNANIFEKKTLIASASGIWKIV
jgi:uncharacterized protein (TIGR00369 family)